MSGKRGTVAIVGAGPGGLAAAKYLRSHGFECVVFEQSGNLGGQWNGNAGHSGVWPSMCTNTSRVMTSFSDLRHDAGVPTYPSNRQALEYLKRYATKFEIRDDVRLNTRVNSIEQRNGASGYTVRSTSEDGSAAADDFEYVVIATGRYNVPDSPKVFGLESFTGYGGVTHAFRYKEPDSYRGMRVLVAGSAISALEIASDLAMLGASRVVSAGRRQRYVMPKLLAGVPTDHRIFTRFSALAGEAFPAEMLAEQMREMLLRSGGDPANFGARKPLPSVKEAGITLSQNFLPLVAEGRIAVKPWISGISGNRVRFEDGSEEEIDAVIFGTGYKLSLPFLSAEIRRTLDVDEFHIDLHKFTFHPELPGMAFIGLFHQVGPYWPVLELQARWITYAWSGIVPMPNKAEMAEGVRGYRAGRASAQPEMMHAMAVMFARAAQVEPEVAAFPELSRALMFGPLAPTSFRLVGPDKMTEAAELFAEDAAAFGAITSPECTQEQLAQLEALKAAQYRSLSKTA